jgi:hypothetical protein
VACFQRASPSSAAVLVEPTMSVKSRDLVGNHDVTAVGVLRLGSPHGSTGSCGRLRVGASSWCSPIRSSWPFIEGNSPCFRSITSLDSGASLRFPCSAGPRTSRRDAPKTRAVRRQITWASRGRR